MVGIRALRIHHTCIGGDHGVPHGCLCISSKTTLISDQTVSRLLRPKHGPMEIQSQLGTMMSPVLGAKIRVFLPSPCLPSCKNIAGSCSPLTWCFAFSERRLVISCYHGPSIPHPLSPSRQPLVSRSWLQLFFSTPRRGPQSCTLPTPSLRPGPSYLSIFDPTTPRV